MLATTLFALVAAATMGCAHPSSGASYEPDAPAPATYEENTTPGNDDVPTGYDNGSVGQGEGGSGYDNGGKNHGVGWGHGGGSGYGNGGKHGGWGQGGNGGGYGGDDDDDDDDNTGGWGNDEDEDDNTGGWGNGYGCDDEEYCQELPDGIPPPQGPHKAWHPDSFEDANPFKNHFEQIGNTCSSVNKVGDGPNQAGCCHKGEGESEGEDGGLGGILGRRSLIEKILNGLLAGNSCTLNIASQTCSSGSVACCDSSKSTGTHYSLVNVENVCLPITL